MLQMLGMLHTKKMTSHGHTELVTSSLLELLIAAKHHPTLQHNTTHYTPTPVITNLDMKSADIISLSGVTSSPAWRDRTTKESPAASARAAAQGKGRKGE